MSPSWINRAIFATAIFATAIFLASAAYPAERDELTISYPEGGQVLAVLTYSNSADMNSMPGQRRIETRYGPIVVRIEIGTSGPETLHVLEWPESLWPYPPEIEVIAGEEGRVEFVAPMS